MKLRRKRRRPVLLLAAALLLAPFALEGAYRAALSALAWRGDVFELYAVGESTTRGEPYGDRLAFPETAAGMFAGRLAGRPIAVLNYARAGDSIYPQAVNIAKRLRSRRRSNPAAVFIYSGHNEKFTEPRPIGAALRLYLTLKEKLLYRSFLASDLMCLAERKLQARGPRTLADYERHMRRVIEFSLASGALPVLSTLVSNQSGVEPTVDCPREKEDALAAGVRAGKFLDPCLAPLADFRRGRLAEAAGNFRAAAEFYRKASDADPHNGFGRATTAQNDLLRSLAREYSIPLVDAARLFSDASPHGIVGNGLMSDGHHPNMAGHLILARAFAATLSSKHGEPISVPLKTPEDAFRWAGYDDRTLAGCWAYSGRWLLTVSVRHPSPAGRMALARLSYEKAAALAPDDFAVRLGLALVLANHDGAFLYDPKVISLIERMSFSSGPFRLPPQERSEWTARLRERGVPETVLAELERTGR